MHIHMFEHELRVCIILPRLFGSIPVLCSFILFNGQSKRFYVCNLLSVGAWDNENHDTNTPHVLACI